MKKIFTLLSLLVLTLTAMATTFTGHRIVTVGYLEPSEMDNTTITVTDKGNGKYDVVFNTSSTKTAVMRTTTVRSLSLTLTA